MNVCKKLCLVAATALIGVSATVCGGIDKLENAAAEEKTGTVYSTRTLISEQGENGFYYAWGRPEKYALMKLGATAGGGYGFRGLEPYAVVSGNYIHPGNFWGVMNIWVAPEGGSVQIAGTMEKGSKFGDGVTMGIYHQSNGGELETLTEKFISPENALIQYPVDQTITVKKGDSIIFYCDSGLGKDNASDSSDFSCTITYTQNSGDIAIGEDLSKYLNVGTPAEIAGVQHVEKEFAAEVLDGTNGGLIKNDASWSKVSELTKALGKNGTLPYFAMIGVPNYAQAEDGTYIIPLMQNAPDGWDGRVQLTYYMADAGKNVSAVFNASGVK